MAHRSVEILIGRLLTDEAFRAAFVDDAATALTRFMESGQELTPSEIAAINATRCDVWAQAAEHIDPRLQEASISCRSERVKDINA